MIQNDFFDLWAAKESLVKASGKGVFAGMKDITIPMDHDGIPLNMRVGDFFSEKSRGWISLCLFACK